MMKWFLLLALLACSARAATHSAVDASYAEVLNAYNLCVDGDTLAVPAGSATWTSGLTVTKNISIVGAGEGLTIITEDLPRTGTPFLFKVTLSHDSAAPDYSFRLSGFTFQSATTTLIGGFLGMFRFTGLSAAASSPYILGCVSRVRLDHITFSNVSAAPAIVIDSCLGVGDHLTIDNGTKHGAPTKVYMHNWTPSIYDKNGTITPVTMTTLAKNAYGSWADDPYFGTDKFWFWEDCNFSVSSNTNASDNEQGGRVVFRHCTFNGGSIASHGFEGSAAGGVRVQEVYNNYFNFTGRQFAQIRSGTVLWFNNLSTAAQTSGIPFHDYRISEVQNNWGGADGTNRYDDNGALLYSGTVTAVGADAYNSITDTGQANFNSINLTDGALYVAVDTDVEANTSYGGPASTADAGWKYRHTAISDVNGQTLTLLGDKEANGSPQWAIGHHYEIRKINVSWGQVGRGKGNMLNTGTQGKGGYTTYDWPDVSGTKSVNPWSGYDLEPCYSWNNYDTASATYFDFVPGGSTSILADRDYFNLGHITPETTQQVGYPQQDYTHATAAYPDIGQDSDQAYTPYTYPNPLASDNPTGIIIQAIPATINFGNVIVGDTAVFTYDILNAGDAEATVSNPTNPAKYTDDYAGGTIAKGGSVTVAVTYTPTAEETNSGDISIASDGNTVTVAVTGDGKTPADPPPGDRAYGVYRKIKSILSHLFP